jgi:hypothetical protein
MPDRASRAPASPPSAARSHWRLGAYLDGLAIGASPVPRAGLEVRRAWDGGASVGVAVSVASGYATKDPGGGHLLWGTATVDGCPFRLALVAGASLSPCVPVEAGVLAVSGANVPNAKTQARPWVSVGALARVEVPLGASVIVEGHGGISAPLWRDTFYFLPTTDVYQPPSAVGWGGIALAVAIP